MFFNSMHVQYMDIRYTFLHVHLYITSRYSTGVCTCMHVHAYMCIYMHTCILVLVDAICINDCHRIIMLATCTLAVPIATTIS